MVVQVSRAATEGQRIQGGVSRSLGGRDDTRSQSSSTVRRWIPPSTLGRDALTRDNRDDLTFRKIRGLLNKLTPETFEKLSNELLNVGLNARDVLLGLILLIFQKALDEPKYCSMYAQLCKKLSEEAPNFEPAGKPCTFNSLLLQQCQEEFEKRRRSKEVSGEDGVQLTPAEEEQRQSSRRKMVANLRFIGELGKLQIIQKAILYHCVEELLEKSRRSHDDLAEDLECLCQIIRTSGRILDTPEAQNLMEQYFARIQRLSVNTELAIRIRFMLQDILDLRAAAWRPRKITVQDGPKTILQVREQAARDMGVYIPPPNASPHTPDYLGSMNHMPGFFTQGSGPRTGMDDVFGAPLGGNTSLGTGPGVISSQPDKMVSFDSNGYGAPPPRGDVFSSNRHRPGQQNYQPTNAYYQNKHFTNAFSRQGNGYQQQNNSQSSYNNGGKEIPPRFKKMYPGEGGRGGQHGGMGGDHHNTLRPQGGGGMSLKPRTPGLLPQSALSSSTPPERSDQYQSRPHYPTLPPNPKPASMAPVMHKDSPPIIVRTADKSNKAKKEKTISRGEHMKRVREVVKELGAKNPPDQDAPDRVETAVAALTSMKLPERLSGDAAHAILSGTLQLGSGKRGAGAKLLVMIREKSVIAQDRLWEGVKQVLSDATTNPVSVGPLSEVLAALVVAGTVSLGELAEAVAGGSLHPFYLQLLHHIHRSVGRQRTLELFTATKVNLLTSLPETQRTAEALSSALEERKLAFLVPLLGVEARLTQGLKADPTPVAFFSYIKETVDVKHHTDPAFITALVTVLVSHISSGTGTEGAEKEREMMARYKGVLQAFVHDHPALQITAIYALQVLTYTAGFPKGMLLRWFVFLYDLEIVEEEAFLTWKEDVNDDYPGKGKALFQVNQWLTWLQTTEEEDEDDE